MISRLSTPEYLIEVRHSHRSVSPPHSAPRHAHLSCTAVSYDHQYRHCITWCKISVWAPMSVTSRSQNLIGCTPHAEPSVLDTLLSQAEKALKAEDDRLLDYLDGSSRDALLARVEDQLLKKHKQQLLERPNGGYVQPCTTQLGAKDMHGGGLGIHMEEG